MQQRVVTGPTGQIAVTQSTSGTGTPVIFLHSDGGVRAHWDAAMRHFGGRRAVAAFDRRGHGESDAPGDGRHGYAACNADVDAVADALGFVRFFLVGHGGGGAMAFAYAGHAPQRVVGLALLNPVAEGVAMKPKRLRAAVDGLRSDDFEENFAAYCFSVMSIAGPDEAVTQRVLQDFVKTPKETILGNVEGMKAFDPVTLAAAYDGPRLSIIQSSWDAPGALHRLGAGFPFKVIDGAGHWMHLAAPDRVHALLDDFLLTNDA